MLTVSLDYYPYHGTARKNDSVEEGSNQGMINMF